MRAIDLRTEWTLCSRRVRCAPRQPEAVRMLLTLRTRGGFPEAGVVPAKKGEDRADRIARRHASKTAQCRPDTPRRILALCLGGIGDTVLAFSALRDLRQACPHDRLTALAMWPQSAELLTDLGIFDEVLCHNFQRDRSWRSLLFAWKLRMRHFDASLLAFPTNRFEYNVLSYLIGARRRVGHNYLLGGNVSGLRFLLTERVAQALDRHTIDENRALVSSFVGRSIETPADIRLGPLDPKYHTEAARLLSHLQRPLVGIHAGCSVYKGHAARRWPAQQFGKLCRQIIDQLDCQPVVFGMPDEFPLKLEVQRACPEVFMAHGDSIRLTAAMVARCSAFVSNDSSLAHIASALDVPVVMICGPTRPGMIEPRSRGSVVVASRLSCAPCFQVGRKPLKCTHRIYQACLKSITVEDVLAVLTGMVATRPSSTPRSQRRSIHLPILVPALPIGELTCSNR